jgi:hypothetical protein
MAYEDRGLGRTAGRSRLAALETERRPLLGTLERAVAPVREYVGRHPIEAALLGIGLACGVAAFLIVMRD